MSPVLTNLRGSYFHPSSCGALPAIRANQRPCKYSWVLEHQYLWCWAPTPVVLADYLNTAWPVRCIVSSGTGPEASNKLQTNPGNCPSVPVKVCNVISGCWETVTSSYNLSTMANCFSCQMNGRNRSSEGMVAGDKATRELVCHNLSLTDLVRALRDHSGLVNRSAKEVKTCAIHFLYKLRPLLPFYFQYINKSELCVISLFLYSIVEIMTL